MSSELKALTESIMTAYESLFETVGTHYMWQRGLDKNTSPNDYGPVYMPTESYVQIGIPKNARMKFGRPPAIDFPVILPATFSSWT